MIHLINSMDYFLYILPGLLLTMWAQWRIKSAYAEGSRVAAKSGLTGAEAADAIMKDGGATGVAIEPVAGLMTDHYDPQAKVLRLSEGVYGSRSLAAVGIAAHEAGHAIQDATQYPGLVVRNLIVPLASLGSSAFAMIIAAGLLLQSPTLIIIGIIVFSLTVVSQLINLPVEFNASRRARRELLSTGLVSPEEDEVVGNVLNAAAWTYVAGALTSVFTLLFYISQVRGSRRRQGL
jgi:Zn-dependent membrane protease YugP